MKLKLAAISLFIFLLAGSLQAGWFDKAKEFLEDSGVTSGEASNLNRWRNCIWFKRSA